MRCKVVLSREASLFPGKFIFWEYFFDGKRQMWDLAIIVIGFDRVGGL